MSKKHLKYKPVKKNENLDLSLALSQACSLLDQVAAVAIVTSDSELLIAISDRWIEIGKMFTAVESDEFINTSNNVEPYGFAGGIEERDEVTEQDE